MLISAIKDGRIKGVLLRMGNSVRDVHMKTGAVMEPADYDAFQHDDEVALALAHPTGLKAIPERVFDRIARHGHELANATLTRHTPENSAPPLHGPRWYARQRAATARQCLAICSRRSM